MAISWTDAQDKFLETPRGHILVSAAAGSGKTATLVERVSRHLENNTLTPDRLLMTTFTKTAASEMSSRIENNLYKKMLVNPKLEKQYDRLSNAQIGTIHSFCFKILRENFSQAGIMCDFKVADETDIELLKIKIAADVVKKAYDDESQKDALHLLVEILSGPKTDKALENIILEIYSYIIAMPFPEDVLDKWSAISKPTFENYKLMFADIREKSLNLISIAERKMNVIFKNLEHIESEQTIEKDILAISNLKTAISDFEFNLKDELQNSLKFPATIGFHRSKVPCEPQEIIDKRKDVKEIIAKVLSLVSGSDYEKYKATQEKLYPNLQTLFSLVKTFMSEFSNKKREKNILDFNDAEQLVLKLLYNKKGESYVETELAREISNRYTEIYIDEYQDVNAAQEKIFQAICRDDNVYMVGDVKQSIYGFRQSDPEIFKEKSKEFNKYNGQSFPAKIFFNENFRSRKSVTNFVNLIFETVMTEDVCKATYGKDEKLSAKAKYFENPQDKTELLMYDFGASGPIKYGKTCVEIEAEITAKRIKQLVDEGYKIARKNEQTDEIEISPCTYGDFCILLRTYKEVGEIYQNALEKQGIKYITKKSGTDFLNTREILLLRGTLKAINNPYDDIAIVSAMLSPFFSFTPSELAQIKIEEKHGPIFDKVKKCAENGNEKCKKMLDRIRTLQHFAASQSVDEFLKVIYKQHGFYDMVCAMNNGEMRCANLDLMRHYARTFEQNGYKGLAEFVKFIESLVEKDKKLGGAKPENEGIDAVKIMTIHESKGLEFPICILGLAARGFNEMYLRESHSINKEFGAAFKIKDIENSISYKTPTFKLFQYKVGEKNREEEMRLLYVALTRAKEKLIIPIVPAKLCQTIEKCISAVKNNDIEYMAQNTKCYADWILLSCIRSKSMQNVISELGLDDSVICTEEEFSAKIITLDEQVNSTQPKNDLDKITSNPQIIQMLKTELQKKYPFEAQTEIVSKMSVSELVKGEKESEYDFEELPDFMREENLTGAQRGTALHTFMQYASFENAQKDTAAEIQRIKQMGFLDETEANAIDTQKLTAFFESDLYNRIKNADEVFREYKFASGVDSVNFGGESGAEDVVIIQGVADCILIEGGSATIIDYKTDNVKTPNTLVDRYSKQLSIYKGAIEKMLGIPVKQCLIYSFSLNCQIEIEAEEIF